VDENNLPDAVNGIDQAVYENLKSLFFVVVRHGLQNDRNLREGLIADCFQSGHPLAVIAGIAYMTRLMGMLDRNHPDYSAETAEAALIRIAQDAASEKGMGGVEDKQLAVVGAKNIESARSQLGLEASPAFAEAQKELILCDRSSVDRLFTDACRGDEGLAGLYQKSPELKYVACEFEARALGLTDHGLPDALAGRLRQLVANYLENPAYRGDIPLICDLATRTLALADPGVHAKVRAQVVTIAKELSDPRSIRQADARKLGMNEEGNLTAEGQAALRRVLFEYRDLSRVFSSDIADRLKLRDPDIRKRLTDFVEQQSREVTAIRSRNQATQAQRAADLRAKYPPEDPDNQYHAGRSLNTTYDPAMARLARGVTLEQVIAEFAGDDEEEQARLAMAQRDGFGHWA
jgi:hypothetical protein